MDATTVLDKTQEIFNARRLTGEPYETNGITVLPVMTIRGGGGGGSGEATDKTPGGAGGGIGINAHPVGAYVIRGENVTWLPAIDVNRVIAGAQMVMIVAFLVARSIVRSRTRRLHFQLRHEARRHS